MRHSCHARAGAARLMSMSGFEPGTILLALVVFALAQLAVADEHAFEEPADLSAGNVLPSELLQGKHHVVDDRVRSDGYLNYYTIRSDFGEFEAASTATLRTRIGEINALAELDKLSKTEVFAEAAANAGKRQVRTLQAFAARPVDTVKGIPRGVGRMFKRYKRQASEAVDSTQEYIARDGEESGSDESEKNDDSNRAAGLTKSYFGVDKAQRAWSRKLGTDPYSGNEVLRAAIKEVAWAERLGRFGMGFAGVPKIPGASIIGDVNEAVWSKDPYELRDLNQARLVATGADEVLIEQYLDNPRMTPTQQTLLTAAIAELADVENRDGMLRQALLPETEEEMNFQIRSAILLAWFHINSQAFVTVNTDGVLPAGITSSGTMVFLVAADHVYWSETISQAAADHAELLGGGRHREVWLLGGASNRCKDELESLGFDVHTDTAALMEEGA